MTADADLEERIKRAKVQLKSKRKPSRQTAQEKYDALFRERQERIQRIKANNPIRPYIKSVLGRPARSLPSYDFYCAPWRQEHEPSLAVYEDHFYDYGGNNGDEHGDVINFVMLYYGVDFNHALDMLDGQPQRFTEEERQRHQQAAERASQRTAAIEAPMLSLTKVSYAQNALLEHLSEAKGYLTKRHVFNFALNNNWGYFPAHEHHYYIQHGARAGQRVTITAPMIVIPNVWPKQTKAWEIKYRLDQTQAERIYDELKSSEDERWWMVYADMLARFDREPTDKEMFSVLFRRFDSDTGGIQQIWNYQLLFDDDKALRPWPYMFVVEGQFCMASLCELGYPAIILPDKNSLFQYFPTILSNIGTVIVIADDDENKHGLRRAERIANAIGSRARIFMPPYGKDVNDAIQANRLGWLLDFEPVLKGEKP